MRVKLVRRKKKTRTSGSKAHEKQRFNIFFFPLTFAFSTRATDFDEEEGLLVVTQVIKGDRTEVILNFEES